VSGTTFFGINVINHYGDEVLKVFEVWGRVFLGYSHNAA